MTSTNPSAANLNGMHVAILATDGFEEVELTEPMKALQQAGAQVDVIAPKGGEIQAFRHFDKSITVPVNKTLDAVNPADYDALVLPGGALNADAMRTQQAALRFIQEMDRAGKPMAMICHAPWELVSAGCVRGRTLTSWPSIQDDIRNAGGNWVDREVNVEHNLVTSRMPDDLPAFNREMLTLFAHAGRGTAQGARS